MNSKEKGREKSQKPIYKKWWFWVIVVVLVGGVSAGLSGGDEPSEQVEAQVPSTPPSSISESSGVADQEATGFVLDVDSLTDADAGPLDTGNLKLKFGDLVSVNYGGDGVIVVKGKIQSQLSNDLTIKQNYHSVCDLVKNWGFDSCRELQYWAVADMSSGDEAKVISFTLDRATIEGVANETILDTQLGDYVSDLYIHPSLE